jgi:GMP synthase-like glutamine amidotransferase
MRAVCLQHVPFEGLGAFAAALAKRGVHVEHYLVPQDGLPENSGDLLIVMGGPMSVNDPDPWIADETSFIRSALLSNQPMIGVFRKSVHGEGTRCHCTVGQRVGNRHDAGSSD